MAGSRDRTATRRIVISAAVEVFAERGYSGASIEAIAQASGLTIGALYSNFSGKRELFLAALREAIGTAIGIGAGSSEGVASTDSMPPAVAADRLVDQGTQSLQGWERDPTGFRLLLWSVLQAQTDDDVRELVTALLREGRERHEALLKDIASSDGPLRLKPREAATALNAMLIGFELQRMLEPRRVTKSEGQRMVAAYIEGLLVN